MSASLSIASPYRLASPSGLCADFNGNGSIRHFDAAGVTLNLFVGSEADGGPANLWLRRLRPGSVGAADVTTLLGSASPTAFRPQPARRALDGSGEWMGLRYRLAFDLADALPAWGWRVDVHNASGSAVDVDLVYAQDLALAPYARGAPQRVLRQPVRRSPAARACDSMAGSSHRDRTRRRPGDTRGA